jgi:hypothetical protein
MEKETKILKDLASDDFTFGFPHPITSVATTAETTTST